MTQFTEMKGNWQGQMWAMSKDMKKVHSKTFGTPIFYLLYLLLNCFFYFNKKHKVK